MICRRWRRSRSCSPSPIAPTRCWLPRPACRIEPSRPHHRVQIEHRWIAAELRQQRVNLRAMMSLMIEEVRQDHVNRILRLNARIVDVVQAALEEARRQIAEESLYAAVCRATRLAQR